METSDLVTRKTRDIRGETGAALHSGSEGMTGAALHSGSEGMTGTTGSSETTGGRETETESSGGTGEMTETDTLSKEEPHKMTDLGSGSFQPLTTITRLQTEILYELLHPHLLKYPSTMEFLKPIRSIKNGKADKLYLYLNDCYVAK